MLEALLKLALIFVFGTFLTSFIWLSIYRLLGFLMPDWLAGWFALPIIWVSHQKRTKILIIALIASTIIGVLIWIYLWLWMVLLGGLGVLEIWFFSYIQAKPAQSNTSKRIYIGVSILLVVVLITLGIIANNSRSNTSQASNSQTQTDYSTPSPTSSQSTSTPSLAPATFPCNRGVVKLAWSPNQPYLAVICSNGINPVSAIVDVWNVQTKQKLFTLPGDDITAVAWSPDGTKLAMGLYAAKTVKVLSLNGQTLLTVQGVSDTDVSWSPDGKYIFGGGNYPVVIDSSTGSVIQNVWETSGWSGGSNFIWLSNDTIVGLDSSNTMIVEWNSQTKQYTTIYKENYYPYDFISSFALSPDGTKIVLGLEGSDIGHTTLRIISASGVVLADQKTMKNDVRAVAWSPDGKFIAYSSYALGTITISDAQSGQQVSTKEVDTNVGNTIIAVAWSSDSTAIAVGTVAPGSYNGSGQETQIISVV